MAKYKNVGVGNNNEMDKMNCTNFNEKKKRGEKIKRMKVKWTLGGPWSYNDSTLV